MNPQLAMSSPASAFGHWPTTRPEASPSPTGNDCDQDGVSVRPMRLKVLYTFDDQNKTNCLARWPDVLNVQTVVMDETISIGVVELKTCIRAIVQCSPELVAKLGQDYTVYAYDYSEHDNPLVGQGMLSWALAASSHIPTAQASQSQQLVTGRVCKNLSAIFSNGIKETLEVKLRLVPVPTLLQSEYIQSIEKYREISKVLPAGFDYNEWNAFLQSNPSFDQMASTVSCPTPSTTHQRDGITMEILNQLLSPRLQQQPLLDALGQLQNVGNQSFDGPSNTIQAQNTSRPSSRASTKRAYKKRPKMNGATGGNTSGYEEGTDGDEGSALKKRGRKDAPAGSEEVNTDTEETGRKKRAKITKTDWTSKDTIGAVSDSLRVTASTAGSLRMFRPIAMNPNPPGDAANRLQEVPRAPTPVPRLPNLQGTRRTKSQSALRRGSMSSQPEPRKHVSPYPPLIPPVENDNSVIESIESTNPSPERPASNLGTPPGAIRSSPPVMRTTSIACSPNCPSSPELPQMPRTDSGFMSGTLDDLFGDDEFDLDQSVENEQFGPPPKKRRARASNVHHGFAIREEVPGPVEFLPTRMIRNTPPPQPRPVLGAEPRPVDMEANEPQVDSRAAECGSPTPCTILQGNVDSSNPDKRNGASNLLETQEPPRPPTPAAPVQASIVQPQSRAGSRQMIRTASMGSLTLPTVPASDPTIHHSHLNRSQTWSQTPHATTEAATPPENVNELGYTREQSFEHVKNTITRKRLEQAIEKGEMPPFCTNCGAIDTPTWRKAFVQEIKGTPGYYDYSDAPGRVTAVEVLTRDPDGKPTSFRIIKKNLARSENKQDFKEIVLCNPCGIWISKYKVQRPEEKYIKTAMEQPARRRRKKDQNAGIGFPTSEAYLPPSEGYFPQPEAPQPSLAPSKSQQKQSSQQTGTQAKLIDIHDTTVCSSQQEYQDCENEEPQPHQRRASSIKPYRKLKAMTSEAASSALRRAIQSSPARWQGTRESPIEVEETDLGLTRRLLFPSPRKDGSPKVLDDVLVNVASVIELCSSKESLLEAANKENCPPALGQEDEDLMKLFEEEMARPKTPVRKSPVATNPFKTPTRPTPNHRPVTRSVTRSGRSIRSSGQLLLVVQKTPTRTPRSVRRSPRNHQAVFDSPFTATLNQLMSDANNNSISPSRRIELDFGTLPPLDGGHDTLSFTHLPAFDSDFFSTDVPMPSSPPRMSFDLYEDASQIDDIWNLDFDGKGESFRLDADGDEVILVKTEPGNEEHTIIEMVNDEE